MLSLSNGLRVYLATGVTDMRKSIDTLAIVVADRLAQDPLSGHLISVEPRLGSRKHFVSVEGCEAQRGGN